MYLTDQENFWAGSFGDNYIIRNKSEELINSNVLLFRRILRLAPQVLTITELGCNIGLNLQALKIINPDFKLTGYEINEKACAEAISKKCGDIRADSILNALPRDAKSDLTFTKGVLIHINPNELLKVYENLYELSARYILVCEYYNPDRISVEYRGHKERLFKGDFAGELIDMYKLRLIDYGFVYHRDNNCPQDDFNWFLLEK